AAVLVVERLRDARLAGQELAAVGRWQGQEGHDAGWCRGRDGADERQMPDDVADPLLALYDDGRCHVLAFDAVCEAGPFLREPPWGGNRASGARQPIPLAPSML